MLETFRQSDSVYQGGNRVNFSGRLHFTRTRKMGKQAGVFTPPVLIKGNSTWNVNSVSHSKVHLFMYNVKRICDQMPYWLIEVYLSVMGTEKNETKVYSSDGSDS